jgi:glycosyltransferase involved in cell wall biosynthesis
MSDYKKPKVVVVMPAYNASKTLRMTYKDLPHDLVDLVLLVDDGSLDETVGIARQLDLELFIHNRNYGYGANQKTCYIEALKAGADIIVMVHPDYQYDPTLLPEIVRPIQQSEADVVLGSRLMGGSPIKQGMPWWKYYGNRLLSKIENLVFGLNLSDYHTGYRAYHKHVLETINFQGNSDGFIFDQEVIAQVVDSNFRIAEISVPTRYFPEASSVNFTNSVLYGLRILSLVTRYWFHKQTLVRHVSFESLSQRYVKLDDSSQKGSAELMAGKPGDK